MRIPFLKAEGAGNDFLITPEEETPANGRCELAKAICHRHLGVGADGWYLVRRGMVSTTAGNTALDGVDAEIHLYNSDGSEAELSGNGTRCVVAWLASISPGKTDFLVRTGAGLRHLHLLDSVGQQFRIGMHMGNPRVFEEESIAIGGEPELAVRGNRVDPGNPQFAVEVNDLSFPWKERGLRLEGHPTFPQRSNISFYRVLSSHSIEARFYERGAGATLSSGTGSTGALAAAIAKGKVALPAVVETEAGPLHFRKDSDGLILEGTATLLAEGFYHWDDVRLETAKGRNYES
ncbi:MAG: diaminopimelate epimerase [Bryobacterales bacterium]|nr:diaminopimelate epimerase [Bryobacterales bacterium]